MSKITNDGLAEDAL